MSVKSVMRQISEDIAENEPEVYELLSELGRMYYYSGNFKLFAEIMVEFMNRMEKEGYVEQAKELERELSMYEELTADVLQRMYRDVYGREVVPVFDYRVERWRDMLTGEFLSDPSRIDVESVAPYYKFKDFESLMSELKRELV